MDKNDYIFKTKEAKFGAVLNDLVERHEKGQPVLVGTIAVETSEYLSQLLTRRGIPHTVLNAKQHEREAEIIVGAGQLGAVTIATNMAGRGVDIKLGEGVREAGGLYVLGTERHEARRIDNQLRGRSGRQGDPGESRFYLSGEDDLVRLFAGDRIKNIMTRFKLPDDQPMEAKILSNQIEGAQKKVEEQNFVMRKNVLKYDDVMNTQRMVIYEQRRRVLEGEDLSEDVHEWIREVVERTVDQFLDGDYSEEWDLDALVQAMRTSTARTSRPRSCARRSGSTATRSSHEFVEDALDEYRQREERFGVDETRTCRSCASSSGSSSCRSSTRAGASTSSRWTTCARASTCARSRRRTRSSSTAARATRCSRSSATRSARRSSSRSSTRRSRRPTAAALEQAQRAAERQPLSTRTRPRQARTRSPRRA